MSTFKVLRYNQPSHEIHTRGAVVELDMPGRQAVKVSSW